MDSVSASPRVYNKDNPFPARIIENRLLSRDGSLKETRHFVVDIAGSGLTYAVGDSLGIFPTNHPDLVDEILSLLDATGREKVTLPRTSEQLPLRDALFSRLSLAGPTRKTLEFFLEKITDGRERIALETLLRPEAKEELAHYLANREHVDLLEEFRSARFDPQELVDQLRRLVPRLYSIASSPLVFPDKVHLTVAIVRYVTNDRQRHGVCTTFKADRVEQGRTPVPVFVASSHFGLPEDDDADVIMVGPGTGVAPFRAFLQEREARGARGRNWLFFGDQRKTADFLYEDEFIGFRERGILHRMNVAFSRDQDHKIYVQDRMRENTAELWRWIADGAYFYVCGDARRMAKDVDAALKEIIAARGGVDSADEYVKAMRREKRYQRDIY